MSATQPSRAASLHHPPLTIALHWASVLLVVLATATILLREIVDGSPWRTLLLETHRQAGLLVLLAWAARLAARFTQGLAPTHQGMPLTMRLAATAAHWALYGVLLVLPVLGWAATNAHGVALRLLGLVPLGALVQADADLADTLTDNHVLAAWALLGLVGLHIAGALYHHYGRRDEVLSAMLPTRGAAPAAQPAHKPADLRRAA